MAQFFIGWLVLFVNLINVRLVVCYIVGGLFGHMASCQIVCIPKLFSDQKLFLAC